MLRTTHFYPTNNYPLDRRFIRWIGLIHRITYPPFVQPAPEDLSEKASVIEDNRTYVETVVGPQAVDESKTKILGLSWDTKKDELFSSFPR
jgi:hypothetical protein